ncbi:hypothetical protein AAG570_002827 [Ranatra chinensis]|uniref:Uncharacterized protein n=1 Tax=Ranatra chinensis TaxID=642074 RepID=A0ABD0Y5L8_9HEMI
MMKRRRGVTLKSLAEKLERVTRRRYRRDYPGLRRKLAAGLESGAFVRIRDGVYGMVRPICDRHILGILGISAKSSVTRDKPPSRRNSRYFLRPRPKTFASRLSWIDDEDSEGRWTSKRVAPSERSMRAERRARISAEADLQETDPVEVPPTESQEVTPNEEPGVETVQEDVTPEDNHWEYDLEENAGVDELASHSSPLQLPEPAYEAVADRMEVDELDSDDDLVDFDPFNVLEEFCRVPMNGSGDTSPGAAFGETQRQQQEEEASYDADDYARIYSEFLAFQRLESSGSTASETAQEEGRPSQQTLLREGEPHPNDPLNGHRITGICNSSTGGVLSRSNSPMSGPDFTTPPL